jgi:hypothetical protein
MSDGRSSDYFLTTGEWSRWCEVDREFKREMREKMTDIAENASSISTRMAIVENDLVNVKPDARSTSLKWGAGVTTVLTVLIQAALAAFGFSNR